MADPWGVGTSDTGSDDPTSATAQPTIMRFEDDFKPFEKLRDSDTYLSTLENKLERMQGKTKDTTKQDVLGGLSETRQSYLSRLVSSRAVEDIANSCIPVEDDDRPIYTSSISRRICPEKQALTFEELLMLMKADELALVTAEMATMDEETKPEQ